MKSLRRYHSLRITLLLAGILLAAQTIYFWHSHHDGRALPDDHCQLCLHAQHHTPASNSLHVSNLVLLLQVGIVNPVHSETLHSIYQYYSPSRAPPVFFLA